MEISGYLIDIENAAITIKQQGYTTIAIQVPEGLKRSIFPLVDFLKNQTGATVLVSADPCFGACDVVNYELKNMDVDCVVHIGHTAISDVENFWIPTLFVNAQSTMDVSKVVEKAIPSLEGKKIGLVTTAQHLHTLEVVERILQKHGLEPFIAEGDERVTAKGQILGCNFSVGGKISETVDCFLFIGSGTFHPVGLLMSTKKPVIAADPYTNAVKKQEIEDMKNNMLRQRYGAIIACRSSRRYGILIGVKRGQQRIKLAHELQKMLDSAGKLSLLITLDEFSPMSLQGFDVDCYVSTACPRIAIDDYLQYKKPIITPVELEIVLGRREWETYVFDEILA
ncbi:MAG TPA: diphthamide biosynthesis enzyme Dph2 [Thermoplasmata archaeon]|jgi:2-(3-amino-3-carboxypropyl)histidine synthase|nr:MAG TPA: diphthamide biosynthesis enzyme Dph2 [Thermoplasmata archaeon]